MSVKQVAQKQKITADDVNDRDVIACASDGQDAVVQVFFIRQGKLLEEIISYEALPKVTLRAT